MRNSAIIVLVVLLTSACCTNQTLTNSARTTWTEKLMNRSTPASMNASFMGDYLGQTPPGATPRVFAPGIVSTDHHEHSSPTFSPDGKEIYWSLWRRPDKGEPQVIMFVKKENGQWTSPQVASFSGKYKDGGPVFSADGKKLYFYSRRPLATEKGEESAANHIWVVERTEKGWSEPRIIDFINADGFPSVSPSVAGAGSLYFSGKMEGVRNQTGIYCTRWIDNRYSEPEVLGETVNSQNFDWSPFIARDESYLIFSSDRPGQRGNGDLYISFRMDDGFWSEPGNMGNEVNTPRQERFPCVSPDGKFLFFTRSINDNHDDIFWVDAGMIEQLRAKAVNQSKTDSKESNNPKSDIRGAFQH